MTPEEINANWEEVQELLKAARAASRQIGK
jgi:hypothetical protein